MKDGRVYVCHTFYHVYVACLKELHIRRKQKAERAGAATLVLSTMSNHFGDLFSRARASGLFQEVVRFDEKEAGFFPELAPLKRDTGSLLHNLWNRIRFCRKLAALEAPYVPVDFKRYQEIYVFCDSDPIGYFLNANKIRYHALEDGLNCIAANDTAHYDNRGHFALKAFLAKVGLIFIQNGYAKYCIDMEVNDLSLLKYSFHKYVEVPRKDLTDALTQEDKKLLLRIFIANDTDLKKLLMPQETGPRVLILTEPLCDPETRKRLFLDVANRYGRIRGEKAQIMIKQHPRDLVDYREVFPDALLFGADFPMEMLNLIPGLQFDRIVSIYTMLDALTCGKEKVFLGDDFMDRYEAPEIHRTNEAI